MKKVFFDAFNVFCCLSREYRWPVWQVHSCMLSHFGKFMRVFLTTLASPCCCPMPLWQVHILHSHVMASPGEFYFLPQPFWPTCHSIDWSTRSNAQGCCHEDPNGQGCCHEDTNGQGGCHEDHEGDQEPSQEEGPEQGYQEGPEQAHDQPAHEVLGGQFCTFWPSSAVARTAQVRFGPIVWANWVAARRARLPGISPWMPLASIGVCDQSPRLWSTGCPQFGHVEVQEGQPYESNGMDCHTKDLRWKKGVTWFCWVGIGCHSWQAHWKTIEDLNIFP